MSESESKSKRESESEEITFEDALKQLEEIVHELEESGSTLDNALKRFETGVGLSRLCNRRLDDAEMRIEQLIEGDSDEEDGAEDFPRSERVEI